ncbi:hypothetical protein D039_4523A, partial [Vibrio parahaemolyticus EKP-028]
MTRFGEGHRVFHRFSATDLTNQN